MEENLNQGNSNGRWFFILLTVILFAIFASGLYWIFLLSPQAPVGFGWFLFSFATGLTMIVLPCTLPLAFVIVPLSMGKGYVKGFATALAFGLGVAITLSMYGILAAVLGNGLLGFAGATVETIKNWFYVFGGVLALGFALNELGLITFKIPSYSGAVPAFIQNRADIFKPLLMGLFLGNIGVGCPHPATPILLSRIAIEGDVFYGWLLFFTHAAGRVVPLLFLAMLGIIGINATQSLVKNRELLTKVSAWFMIFVGAFLLVLGLFGHDWWVYSGQHSLFEQITQEERFVGILKERLDSNVTHTHGIPIGTGMFGLPYELGNWLLVLLWVGALAWYWFREKEKAVLLEEPEKIKRLGILRWIGAFFVVLSLLLGTVFLRVVPHWFLQHKALEQAVDKSPLTVSFQTFPSNPIPGRKTAIAISLKNTDGSPATGLKIDHERILHVIFISEDFKYFKHVHPEDFGPVTAAMVQNAAFGLEHTFPKAGRYLMAVDYLHESHHGAQQFLIDVGNRGIATLVKDFSRQKTFSGYQVSLAPEPTMLTAGQEISLRYLIQKNSKPIIDLEAYLGAPMHVAIVSADLSSFQHTHGEIHDPVTGVGKHVVGPGDLFGPDIEAHVTFSFPGIYQIFAEFNHQGKVVVTSFLVEVGGQVGQSNIMQSHGH